MAVHWGRCHRGRVWHLLDQGARDTWCRSGDPIIEWTVVPPSGGRPCPRCTAAVRELLVAVEAAELGAGQEWIPVLETADFDDTRPVADVDLVGALTDRQVQLQLREEGPDPQADEVLEAGDSR